MENVIDLFTESDTDALLSYIEVNMDPEMPLIFWIDLFCGAGGVTEGYTKNNNSFVVACVNHDEFAIKSHHANHPKCIHYTEDIRDWDVVHKIEALIKRLKQAFPNAFIGLHASLECTHFSKAKGGLPRDADSRTLAMHLYKYLSVNPDYVSIENVEEFLSWGPMYQLQKKSKGKTLWKCQNADKKIVWLEFPYKGNQKIYRVKGIKPFEMPIAERKCDYYNRWLRIFTSKDYCYQYQVLNAADFGAFTSRKRYFGIFAKNGLPIEFPEATHVSRKKHHKFPEMKPHNPVREKLNLYDEGVSLFGLNKKGVPYVDATFARVYFGLVKFFREGHFTIRYNGGNMKDKNKSVNEPLGTILTNNTHGLVKPIFLTSYYGNSKEGQGVHSIDEPCNTITTKDRFALHHLQYAYGKSTYSSIDDSAQSITSVPKHELVTTWLYDTQYNRVKCSIDKPCPTIIARQDKKPLYLATAKDSGEIDNSAWQEDDTFIQMLLRTFMRQYGIVDIKIRSLEVDELLRIQGFPDNYVLKGGKTRAMRYIGNSVSPPMAEALGGSIYNGIVKHLKAS